MKNSRNDQEQEFISNEFDKKNEKSHQIENQFIEEYDYFLNEDECQGSALCRFIKD
jgi:hypothetical protein